MKYYLYISDAKVNMLYAQIPTQLREKVAAALKVDLKVIGVTLTSNTPESTRFSKLKFVVEFIQRNEKVGSIDRPDEYFCGTLKMRWGGYPYDNPKMVYFGGVTTHTVLGLGGSLKHVIGNIGDALCVTTPFSHIPFMLSALEQGEESGFVSKHKANRVAVLVAETTQNLVGPEQRLEFCAKRLLESYNREEQKRVVLGSPIYVALAE